MIQEDDNLLAGGAAETIGMEMSAKSSEFSSRSDACIASVTQIAESFFEMRLLKKREIQKMNRLRSIIEL
jgi:hypothetical protein